MIHNLFEISNTNKSIKRYTIDQFRYFFLILCNITHYEITIENIEAYYFMLIKQTRGCLFETKIQLKLLTDKQTQNGKLQHDFTQ